MTDMTEKTGKSVEDAIGLALEELNCGRGDVEVEILAAPSKGLWGILGAKEAKVRVWKKEGENEGDAVVAEGAPVKAEVIETPPDAGDKTANFILDVTKLMGIEASIGKAETDESIHYSLNGPRMGAVIGRRGETLDAIQYLSNIIAGKDRDLPRKRIVVDAEDYRKRREETLVRLATRLAAKAKKSGRRVVLEPMNPQERRVIHTALEKDPDVRSLSEGEEPYRRLVIYPAGGERSDSGGGRHNRSSGGGSRYSRDGGTGNGRDTGRGSGRDAGRDSGERAERSRYSWGMDDGDSADAPFDTDDE